MKKKIIFWAILAFLGAILLIGLLVFASRKVGGSEQDKDSGQEEASYTVQVRNASGDLEPVTLQLNQEHWIDVPHGDTLVDLFRFNNKPIGVRIDVSLGACAILVNQGGTTVTFPNGDMSGCTECIAKSNWRYGTTSASGKSPNCTSGKVLLRLVES